RGQASSVRVCAPDVKRRKNKAKDPKPLVSIVIWLDLILQICRNHLQIE
ncbi:MAG: hypothetical protein ACI9A8_002245, partial [Cryomorphaceae bacterium]